MLILRTNQRWKTHLIYTLPISITIAVALAPEWLTFSVIATFPAFTVFIVTTLGYWPALATYLAMSSSRTILVSVAKYYLLTNSAQTELSTTAILIRFAGRDIHTLQS